MWRLTTPSPSKTAPTAYGSSAKASAAKYVRKRTPRYPAAGLGKLIGVADIQRIDLGIAMCHFELTAAELGLAGQWQICDPGLEMPDDLTEYTASWAGG